MKLVTAILLAALVLPMGAYAESQDDEYLGVTDPFGDPTSYEFAEDEKADKEFFHLGRFIMFGVNFGASILTGNLGKTTAPAFNFGAKLIYFFDKHIGMEFAFGYAAHTENMIQDEVFVTILPITAGFRYYFGTKSAPKFIAMANPYLSFGGGYYIRQYALGTTVSAIGDTPSNGQFGAYVGAGMEFPIYRQTIFLGLDMRYHFVFFFDDGFETLAGNPRSGGLFIPALSLTYNF